MTTPMPDGLPAINLAEVSLERLQDIDDSVLAHALRRFQRESATDEDPIAAFGAFNQHGSTGW
jgi:FXSXX-COOH protein